MTVELDTEPNLTALFAKAALGAIRPGRRESALPTTELARSGVRVDRARLAAYDRVCGFRLTDELPVTFPHLLVFGPQVALMTDDAFPFPMIGLVHVANRITRTRPLHVDEPLVVRVRAEHLRPHERGTQFDMVSEVSADGEPVWTETSTYLRRTGGGTRSEREAAPAGRPTAVWRVPGDTGRRYADVSGDRNPIHLYPLTARLFGFRRAIAHGMWSMARCLAYYEGRLPAAHTVDVRFKLPIPLPATVALTATDDTFELRDQRTGKPHLHGVITP
ncbi:MAG TPA: MaoC/PaaZ C-terminal domain-containing protein [Pseudonocardiaceae bacterium]|jgi:acyl dehydratase|nr:MaoC/PaaZ C-terminal domain-containing protein [Pseudonocardiaceae bacterium]